MKIIGIILALLTLLSISFTGYARIVTCPTTDLLKKNIKIISGNTFAVNVEGIGTMHGSAGHARDISSLVDYVKRNDGFFSAQILGTTLFCNYLGMFPGGSLEIVHWIPQSEGWVTNNENGAWTGTSTCREGIKRCKVKAPF